MRYTLLLAAILCGCATTKTVWHKPGASAQDFNMDAGVCRAQAFSVPNAPAMQIALVYKNCMFGKGWYEVPDGR